MPQRTSEKKYVLIGFLIILSFFLFRELYPLAVKATSASIVIDGVAIEYFTPPRRSKGVVVRYMFEDKVFSGPCISDYCRTLKAGDTVRIKVYVNDPTAFEVLIPGANN